MPNACAAQTQGHGLPEQNTQHRTCLCSHPHAGIQRSGASSAVACLTGFDTYTRRPVAPVCHTALVTPISTEQVERRWQCVQVFDMEKHLEYCGRFQQDPVQNQEYAAAKRSALGPASRALIPAALYHVPHAARSSLLTHSCARPSHCCTTHCRASHAPSSGPVKPPARFDTFDPRLSALGTVTHADLSSPASTPGSGRLSDTVSATLQRASVLQAQGSTVALLRHTWRGTAGYSPKLDHS